MSRYLDLFCESVMTPTPTPYAPKTENSEMPTYIFVAFGDKKESLLSNRGVIISAFSSQSAVDNYANTLYNLIKGAKEVYSIIPELYTQAITKLSDKDYYKYIKANGTKHGDLADASTEDKVYVDALDTDPDFEIGE